MLARGPFWLLGLACQHHHTTHGENAVTITTEDHLAAARQYLAALEGGVVGDALAGFFTRDAVQEELPNRLLPNGARRDLPAILDAAAKGQKVVSGQRFEVLSTVADGDRVALEVAWTGILAVAVGALRAGSTMSARLGLFFEFRDGKIAAQRNYDCYDPF
jgi:ketosteroid isomerase-like protein